MRPDISKLMEQAKQKTLVKKVKCGHVMRDYSYEGGEGWLCKITSPPEAQEEKSFASKEEAIQWGREQGIEEPGYLLIMNI